MILAGLRSLDSVSGSSYYGQLMEKIQAGSSEFISGRDSILIDLSSWYRDSLAPKIETIQDAIGDRHMVRLQKLTKRLFVGMQRKHYSYITRRINTYGI